MIRILIADDQELVRTGFRVVLDAEPDLEVVGEAADGLAALDAAETLKPDVVLMDIRMPNLDGIEATRRLAAADGAPRVLILTTFDLDDYVYEALRAGASGFLLKDARADELRQAIRMVAAGDALLSPAITRRLIESYTRRPPTTAHPAPPRRADPTRTRSPKARRTRTLKRRDRTRTHRRRRHRQNPRRTHLLQTQPPRPRPSRRPRLRDRPRPTRRRATGRSLSPKRLTHPIGVAVVRSSRLAGLVVELGLDWVVTQLQCGRKVGQLRQFFIRLQAGLVWGDCRRVLSRRCRRIRGRTSARGLGR